jgi:hypothetical protein
MRLITVGKAAEGTPRTQMGMPRRQLSLYPSALIGKRPAAWAAVGNYRRYCLVAEPPSAKV